VVGVFGVILVPAGAEETAERYVGSAGEIAQKDVRTPPPAALAVGYALSFDGVDDHVWIDDYWGDFDFDFTLTLEAWIRPSSLSLGGSFAAVVQGLTEGGGAFSLTLQNTPPSSWALSVCQPSCDAATSPEENLFAQRWQHVAGVYDGSNITIYNNGLEVAVQPFSGNVSNVVELIIGRWGVGSITGFPGVIDDVRVWNVARSRTEILTTMYGGVLASTPGLMGYWRFNEGSGQNVNDSSDRGNDGQLGWYYMADSEDPAWITYDPPVPAVPVGLYVEDWETYETIFYCADETKPLTASQQYMFAWDAVPFIGDLWADGINYQFFDDASCAGSPSIDRLWDVSGNYRGIGFGHGPAPGRSCYRARSWERNPDGLAYSSWSNCCCFDVIEALQPDFTFSPSNPEIGEPVNFAVTGVPEDIDRAVWSFGGTGCEGESASQTCEVSLWNDCKNFVFKYASAGTKTVSLTIEIGGESYTAPSKILSVQSSGSCDAGTCSYSISPSSTIFGSNGGTGNFTVSTSTGCSWSASTSSSWITITSGSGTGPGTVRFEVEAGTGLERVGTISVAGEIFTVRQEGCEVLATTVITAVGDTTCGGSTTDTTPELRWSDVNNEDGFKWEVRGAAGTVSGETDSDQTFAGVDSELSPGTYSAWVQALGDNQEYCDSAWSAGCSFTVEAAVQDFADFAWLTEQPKQGERVRFTDLSSDGSVSWHWDFRDGWTSTEQHPAHVFESTGSFSVLLDVEFDSGHLIKEKTITVSGVVQCGNGSCEGFETAWSCPADCPLEPEESGRAGGSDRRPTMPAAAGGVSGAGGTLWKTQAIVYNPGPEPVTFVVEFTARNRTWILQEGPFALEPGRSMYWDNIIEELFNRTGSGGLWIDASAPVLFLTRTYTENPTTKKAGGGTFGEGRYASREVFSLGLGNGEVYLIGLQHDDHFRSNLYFQEVDGSPVTLEVEIFDSSGQRLRRRLVDVDGHSSKLRNLKDLGADGVHSVYATVEVVEGDGRVAVGGSVIDNITGDPTALDAIHPAQVAKKSASEQHFLVAAIAHTTGTHHSVWRSGLTILNPTSVSQTVTLRYEVEVDRTGVIGEFLEESVTISPGQQLDWKDVLVEFFGAPENAKTQGALHVFSSDSLMVNSRTYNERSDGGTFGLGLPGLKSGDLVSSEGERGIIVGLKNSGGTRTNLGLAEYSGEDTEVNILFYTTEQENLFLNRNDPVEPVVPANSHFQLLNIFQQIESLRDITFEKVKAEVVVENGGLIYSYATTIDNESGDPTAFTAVKE